MHLSPRTKEWIAWGALSVVLTLIAIFLGVSYPAPPQPALPIEALGTTHFTAVEVQDLTVSDDATIGDDLSVSDAVDIAGAVDINGQTLTLDSDADTTLQASVDDTITITLGAAGGRLDVLTGSVRVGDGAPGETHDGEDLYVEGISEVDGAAYFDGAVDMDSALNVAGVTTLAANVENVIAPSVATASITYTAASGGSGTVATIADGEVWAILGAYARVTADWDATGDDAYCDIGDDGDVDGLLDLDDGELQAADTEGTGAAAGWQGFMSTDTRGAYMAATPYIYAPSGADETIDWACGATGDDLSAGELTITILYIRLQ